MKALTLIHPWAYAIAHCGKDVENRTWKPPESLLGRRFAIHAGKKIDEAACESLRARGFIIPSPSHYVHGAVVATAYLDFWTENYDSPWFEGPIGWKLYYVSALRKPVPCRGAQGLWTLPPDVEHEVFKQVPR